MSPTRTFVFSTFCMLPSKARPIVWFNFVVVCCLFTPRDGSLLRGNRQFLRWVGSEGLTAGRSDQDCLASKHPIQQASQQLTFGGLARPGQSPAVHGDGSSSGFQEVP